MLELKELDRNYSHIFVVNEMVYKSFQQGTGDYNPLHCDVSFAKGKGFPQCVMYGNILNGFLSYFIGMMLPTQDVIIHSQDITYKNPVYLNDELTFTAKVEDISEAVKAIIFKYTFRNNVGKIVAKGHIQIGLI